MRILLFYLGNTLRCANVDGPARGKRLGSKLIEQAESFAKEKHCSHIMVDTFNWQAKGFYEKMKYKIEHIYNGYACDGKFYFFRKNLLQVKSGSERIEWGK